MNWIKGWGRDGGVGKFPLNKNTVCKMHEKIHELQETVQDSKNFRKINLQEIGEYGSYKSENIGPGKRRILVQEIGEYRSRK